MEHDPGQLAPFEIRVVATEPHTPVCGSLEDETPKPPAPPRLRSRKRLAAILFATTCVSTFLVGMTPGHGPVGAILLCSPQSLEAENRRLEQLGHERNAAGILLLNGLLFSAALMLTLLAHETGHFLMARWYRVPASLPYFLPFPISPFGTMGAVIVQGGGYADRKKMFDIAISGPLAGLVLALPITWIGLQQASFGPVPEGGAGIRYGEPLILVWMAQAVHGAIPEGYELGLNPLLFAGWVGIFITALNLIPIGQLDGGHILYTLIGKRAHVVAVGLLAAAVALMVFHGYYAYSLMVVLLMMMGPRHPPTADDNVSLGRTRFVLGWLTLAFIIVGFTPQPIVQ